MGMLAVYIGGWLFCKPADIVGVGVVFLSFGKVANLQLESHIYMTLHTFLALQNEG